MVLLLFRSIAGAGVGRERRTLALDTTVGTFFLRKRMAWVIFLRKSVHCSRLAEETLVLSRLDSFLSSDPEPVTAKVAAAGNEAARLLS